MAIAARAGTDAWGAQQWPMTREAWDALEDDARRLSAQVSAKEAYVTGRLDGDADAPTFVPNIAGQQLLRQLNNLRDVLERAVVVEDGEVAVIGRRVTLQELDGTTSTLGATRRGRLRIVHTTPPTRAAPPTLIIAMPTWFFR